MSTETAQRMLQAACLLVIGFGALAALAAHPATDGIMVFFADLVFWPLDGAQNAEAPVSRLILGIAGGLMSGWGVLMLKLAGEGLRTAPELSLRLIRMSILSWFVVDSAASWVAGAPLNIVGNAVFLVLFLWPVAILGRRYQRQLAQGG